MEGFDYESSIIDFSKYIIEFRKNRYNYSSEAMRNIIQVEESYIKMGHLNYSNESSDKDRYYNILPYSFNRVIFQCLPNPYDNYINASRICSSELHLNINDFISVSQQNNKGYCGCSNYFIATQGPLSKINNVYKSTVLDFWKMVIQENVKLIIMLTKIKEPAHGMELCSKYWPESIGECLNFIYNKKDINIKLESESYCKYYIERSLIISISNIQSITVKHLQFVLWPDYDVPNLNEFMDFYQRYEICRKELCTSSPLIIHCSAGVGRTGTLILITLTLDDIDKTGKVRIWHLFKKLRFNRYWFVQTKEQYSFVHEFVLEYILKSGMLLKK